MKVAVFGRNYHEEFSEYIHLFFDILKNRNIEIFLYKPFAEFIQNNDKVELDGVNYFTKPEEFDCCIDFMISIGGDGTFLETLQYVRKTNIPVIGINSGRLGFLANIAKEEISDSMDALFSRHFTYEDRSLIMVKTMQDQFEFNAALNEVSIQKTDSSMITIHTYLNNEFLNSYWTDGLIISSPTGSTGYSLSVGGPIVTPDAGVFVISPIASHNLTVRPVVIPDNYIIKLKVQSRNNKFLAALDSRVRELSGEIEIEVTKAPFTIRMIKMNSNSFYTTLRNKLMWGMDKRN